MEDLAEYDFLPNFNVKLQYAQRDKIEKTNTSLNDFVSLFVGMSVPLNYGGKTSAKVEEAKLKQELFSDQYSSAVQILSKNFGITLAKLSELKEREQLVLEGLYPQAEQSLRAALASYQVGDVDFLNVIDSQNRLFQIETMLYKLRADFYTKFADLEFLAGTSLRNN